MRPPQNYGEEQHQPLEQMRVLTSLARLPTPTTRCCELYMAADYTSAATALFSNVRLPASIVAGVLLPLTFGYALPLEGPTFSVPTRQTLIRAHRVLAVGSYASLLVCIVYASISINALSETPHEAAQSVAELIRRDAYLPWVATNVTFLFGLCGALVLVALRTLLTWEREEGTISAGLCLAALLTIVSVVDDQVKAGGYAPGAVALVASFGELTVREALSSRSPWLCGALVVATGASASTVRMLASAPAVEGAVGAAATASDAVGSKVSFAPTSLGCSWPPPSGSPARLPSPPSHHLMARRGRARRPTHHTRRFACSHIATSLPPQVKVDLAPAVLAAAEADAAASAAAIADVGESAAEEAMVGAEAEVAALEPVADAAPVGDGAAAAAAPVDDAVAADGMVGL